jgi:hypothetical protein
MLLSSKAGMAEALAQWILQLLAHQSNAAFNSSICSVCVSLWRTYSLSSNATLNLDGMHLCQPKLKVWPARHERTSPDTLPATHLTNVLNAGLSSTGYKPSKPTLHCVTGAGVIAPAKHHMSKIVSSVVQLPSYL